MHRIIFYSVHRFAVLLVHGPRAGTNARDIRPGKSREMHTIFPEARSVYHGTG